VAKPDASAALARRFCHALAEETAGMTPGSGRMVHTIAQRMGITFDEASSIADDCARRDWVDHRQHTVSLREEGRMVAAGVRKAIMSKRQPAARPKAARKRSGRSPAK
jgi:cytidylate kinase